VLVRLFICRCLTSKSWDGAGLQPGTAKIIKNGHNVFERS